MLGTTTCGTAGTILGSFLADRLRVAAELLVAGVAFQTTGTRWEVFSHNGEHIGEMSTVLVNETARALKAMGLRSTCITQPAKGEQTSLTFGFSFDKRFPSRAHEMEAIIARRERNFVTMH